MESRLSKKNWISIAQYALDRCKVINCRLQCNPHPNDTRVSEIRGLGHERSILYLHDSMGCSGGKALNYETPEQAHLTRATEMLDTCRLCMVSHSVMVLYTSRQVRLGQCVRLDSG